MRKLSLASGVLPEFGALDVVRAGAEAGFDAVGLWVDPDSWSAADTIAAKSALRGTDLDLLDVEVVWLKPDTRLDAHRKLIDVGVELGAANVLCVSSHPDAGTTAEQLAALCRQAEGTQLRVALEFGIFTAVRDLRAALAVIERVAHPTAAVLVDPIHVDRSGTTVAEVAAIDPALLSYAQFCDAPGARPGPNDFDAVIHDAIDLRRQCGEGALPLKALLEALPADIPLSIELRSAALREAYPDPTARATAVLQATRAWLGPR
ncbi:sugar phosphate isomerase/epimerase [Novosphingobium chloroacetimidivorans]|uniref:Sugar phosphate isomerase/epimerase n=1 Tax=Novosphingobium chloroacetimidivorans TaxID=1428314 RepID=A0A7W7K9G0_9SPHN|nr:sugar phosphate isomerase/epimerase [Novosphingobium chloroacetimidivorans]MBB4858391.1 sugar phosphate isomerase/epimerase [Novosphingobium chloroacetimidivorans]